MIGPVLAPMCEYPGHRPVLIIPRVARTTVGFGGIGLVKIENDLEVRIIFDAHQRLFRKFLSQNDLRNNIAPVIVCGLLTAVLYKCNGVERDVHYFLGVSVLGCSSPLL